MGIIGTSSLLGNMELLVTPEQMYATASTLEEYVSKARETFDAMLQDIAATSDYWQGNAAEKERERFNAERDCFDGLIKNLTNYAGELRVMTGLYEVAESASVHQASGLESGILE